MAIDVRLASVQDAEDIAKVGIVAFANDSFVRARFRWDTATASQIEEVQKYRAALVAAHIGADGSHWFKAIEASDGRLVGYCGIQDPTTGEFASVPAPSYTDHDLDAEFRASIKAAKEAHVGARTDVWRKFISEILLQG